LGKSLTEMAKERRTRSSKTKFSRNWHKARARVQKIHACIGNVRNDYLHKTSTAISKSHALVCVEDLKVHEWLGSGHPRCAPGRQVKAKSALNRAILDRGWLTFRSQLLYKLKWNEGWFVAVAAHNTNRSCPRCSHVAGWDRLSQARFACLVLGFEENADVVGAINILSR
jgi:putative transposase